MRQPFYKKWVSFTRNSAGDPEILDTNNYYPFGLNHIEGPWASAIFGNWSNYKFGGKELQETGMFDFGARFYMPDLGRWGVIDPLAETSRRFTPYNYVYNNPISFIDPDGRKAIAPGEERTSFASGGALEYNLSGRSGSFSNFLGFDDPIDALNRNVKAGGGGNVTKNETGPGLLKKLEISLEDFLEKVKEQLYALSLLVQLHLKALLLQ
ncbi:RHS repeat-associated core domain-containing protein [Chryseobacterium lactis]|uniref:RHS repeat domain-containing protein n=1 Tax=Chryseobacterium lactis TaxID=1241981 RepID=UPI002892E748|nr:RHS repeat-associated core domain-containing protein [Chryseobacterium lactis]